MRSTRVQRSWYLYDFANSAFSTTVVTVFLGPYLTELAQSRSDSSGFISVLGIPMAAESLFPYTISISVLLQVITLPIVGALADHVKRRTNLLGFFAALGSISTMLMYFITEVNYQLGALLLVVANVSFGSSIVVYNSYLPDISSPDERDAVSSKGWGLGYLGGGGLLLANVALFLSAESIGLAESAAVRISLISAGAWWLLFTLVSLKGLVGFNRSTGKVGTAAIRISLSELVQTAKAARKYPQTLKFLIAYLLYNDGIQTVIALAGTYAAIELLLPQSDLIVAILIVQFVALIGALSLGKLAASLGSRKVLLGSLAIWTFAVVMAYFIPQEDALTYYLLAALIGLVLGGSQALSRSLFSQMIPRSQEAQYFAVYEIAERGTSWIGTFLFGLSLTLTGSYRTSILALIVFFIVGGLLLTRVNIRQAISEAGNRQPELI
ncbi:MAG: MFS transporter [Candidatus Nanopelagicales bacterium]